MRTSTTNRTTKKKKIRFFFSIGLAIIVSFLLALAHNMFGRKLLPDLTEGAIMTLDFYVFFLSGCAVLLISLLYLFFVRDISESLAILLTGAWALGSGLEDLFVYMQLGKLAPTYPWLESTPAGIIPTLLGVEVTTTMLILNIVVLGAILTTILYYLYKVEIKLGYINV